MQKQGPKLELDGPLWRFAIAFYERPGVSDTCLQLQGEAGIDVVALIVLLYADVILQRGCGEDEILDLQRIMKLWRDKTVLPLRCLRQDLKRPPRDFPADETESLRGMVKAVELRAEQIQLAMAGHWLAARTSGEGIPLEQAVKLLSARPADSGDIEALVATVIAAARDTAREGSYTAD